MAFKNDEKTEKPERTRMFERGGPGEGPTSRIAAALHQNCTGHRRRQQL